MGKLRQLVGPFFVVAGVMHFVSPRTYRRIMPPWVPAPLAMVYASGVAEIAGGVGMMVPARRRLAGWWLMATMLGVFPANVHMAINAGDFPAVPGGAPSLWARLPLQGVFVAWIFDAMRGGRVVIGSLTAEPDVFRARPEGVRAYRQTRAPGVADCAPSGRVRLDALACWLQDVAYADVEDAGVAQAAVWVVRRSRIAVDRFPRFGERFELTTFCSGIGRMWAERRTDVVAVGEASPIVQAVSLWVHLDPVRWVPTPLGTAEITIYGGAPERKIGHRLRHPAPESTDGGTPWRFRATECDLADHVNNAAYWVPLEEELLAEPPPEPERVDVELEYRTPAQPGDKRVLRSGDRRWIVGSDGELHASFRLLV